MAIWEYEQCLMDVLEASSNQSGAPQLAIDTLQYVKMYQKKMFNKQDFRKDYPSWPSSLELAP